MLIITLIVVFVVYIGGRVMYDRRKWNYGTCRKCSTEWTLTNWSDSGDLYYECPCGETFIGHMYAPTRPERKP